MDLTLFNLWFPLSGTLHYDSHSSWRVMSLVSARKTWVILGVFVFLIASVPLRNLGEGGISFKHLCGLESESQNVSQLTAMSEKKKIVLVRRKGNKEGKREGRRQIERKTGRAEEEGRKECHLVAGWLCCNMLWNTTVFHQKQLLMSHTSLNDKHFQWKGRRLIRAITISMTLLLLLFSRPVVSDSLWPHGLQHARLPYPSHLPEFTEVHVRYLGDDIQPSHPPMPSSPSALNLSQHQRLMVGQ